MSVVADWVEKPLPPAAHQTPIAHDRWKDYDWRIVAAQNKAKLDPKLKAQRLAARKGRKAKREKRKRLLASLTHQQKVIITRRLATLEDILELQAAQPVPPDLF